MGRGREAGVGEWGLVSGGWEEDRKTGGPEDLQWTVVVVEVVVVVVVVFAVIAVIKDQKNGLCGCGLERMIE